MVAEGRLAHRGEPEAMTDANAACAFLCQRITDFLNDMLDYEQNMSDEGRAEVQKLVRHLKQTQGQPLA